MWPSSLLSLATRENSEIVRLCLLMISLAQGSLAITFNPVPSPDLDLSDLGHVGLAGDFEGISLYQYVGQKENSGSSNGSQSLMMPYPDGGFATLALSDASITSMCSFVMENDTVAGVIVGGNFTSLGGLESQGVALFNPNTSAVTALTGLSGKVSAVLCDMATNTVYIGGSFTGGNSTNAIALDASKGWVNLPFEGFNGPVTSITKASNGHVIFGGSFTGLGNTSTPNTPDQQIINIAGANITASSSTTAGFSDLSNIVCNTGGVVGSNNTWLLADNTHGFLKAEFDYGFQPTKLRLWNTHEGGRGTRTWRYTAMPINGIMNFTYLDPATGKTESCSAECPLSNDTSVTHQDFHFVNVIGMDSFQIDISAWYGDGGGLDGIELFENEIYVYAIDSFNEPLCVDVQTASKATVTGAWTVTPSHQSVAQYLTVPLVNGSSGNSTSVVFMPDLKQSGNYSVNMYTPGCLPDDTCASRGRVNITGTMADGTAFQTEIYQSNNYDKYDQIYTGYVAASTSTFRPSVTLQPSSGQDVNLTVVAMRVGFSLISSVDAGLNGLFEYDPSSAVINTTDFSNSSYDLAGTTLGSNASVNALVTLDDIAFVGGNFSATSYNNIFSVSSSGAAALTGGGLNGEVKTLVLNDTILYVGGKFSDLSNMSQTGLHNVAAYDTSKRTWAALGAGVNGQVLDIVPISINVTNNGPEIVITLTGDFDQLNAVGSSQAVSVSGFGVWVPSQSNWLQNINSTTAGLDGALTASVSLSNGGSLFAGSLSSSQMNTNGVAGLESSKLAAFPVHIRQAQTSPTSSINKRSTSNQTVTGVVTGVFYERNARNITILGGHFSADATDGSTIYNLVFINGSNSDTVTGVGSQLDSDSTIMALAVQNDTLFAGGRLSGNVNSGNINGLISYNLLTADYNIQPPALAGSDVVVKAISVRPGGTDVYVGGNFQSAGSLNCPGVCLYDTTVSQWNRPGSTLSGSANAITWAGTSSMVVGGSLKIGGNSSYLVVYNPSTQIWTEYNGASSLPGPVTAITPANSDASNIWVSGTATNGSAFLMMYDGSTWYSAGYDLGPSTLIRGLQVLSLNTEHSVTNLLPSTQTLMLTGAIDIPNFGNASAVLFNGTTFQPYALTSSSGGSAGSLSQIFSQQQNYFADKSKN